MSRIEWAQAKIAQQQEKRGVYAARFAFLDTDQRDSDPERARRAVALAQRLGITIIWQEPDHEGLLLHHFETLERRTPRTKADSMRALLRVWIGYEKNSTAQQYGRKLTTEHIERAGSRHPALNDLLMTIGLLNSPSGNTA